MSKSRGNVVDPWEVIDRHGADAFRWYYLTSQQPWAGYRFSRRDGRRVGAPVPADALEHVLVLRPLRERRGGRARRARPAGQPTASPISTAGSLSRLQGLDARR